MDQYGVVLRTRGRIADVGIRQRSACAQCGQCELAHETKDLVISAINQAGAKKDDLVRLEMGQGNIVSASLIAYGLPLVALFLGVALGQLLFGQAGAALIGFLGLALAYGFIHWRLEPRLFANQRFHVLITAVVNEREVNSSHGTEYEACHHEHFSS